ncbi:MAG: type IX secretion system protein PorQ [Saprospiraceae bacterium]|nr:type IX secretion system protein PorQ [Saprospiraceae bacterium]
MKNFLPLAISLLCCFAPGKSALFAQITGGQTVFKYLSLSPSARATALGGLAITIKDDDLALAALNPAALNASMSGRLAFNHNFFLTDIQHGYAAYAWQMPKIGFTMHGGIQYMNYGDIKQADAQGNISGKVAASETAFTVGAARALGPRLSIGLNARVGFSTLDIYKASALTADAGILYADTARRFSAALVVRNAGTQLSTYNGIREDLPFDIQVGVSKRLRYLPFRLSIIAHHLQSWNIRYNDPNAQTDDVLLFGGDETDAGNGNNAVDNFFRHLIFNGEFLLGRNEGFRIRVGYNHLRKQELTVRNYRSLAGFSGGIGMRISRFRVDVGYASYHLAGGVVHMGIGTNLRDFF